MKQLSTIFNATFVYKWRAIATILFNLFYVLFNLISLVLFVPFLQVIFPSEDIEIVNKPSFSGGGVTAYFEYVSDYYNYFMVSMAQEDPKNALLFVCVTVVIAFFFKSLFRYLAIYHQSQLRMAVVRDYRDKMFSKSMNLPVSFFTEEKKGDLMSRMNSDVNEIEIAVVAVLELIFRDPLSVIITLSVLVYWSPSLTLFSLILLPISALIISRIGKSLKRTASKGQKQLGVLFSFLDEYLGGIRIVKAFNATEESVKKFANINLHHQKLTTRAFRKRDVSSPLNEFLGAVVMISIVWFGGSMILDGTGNGFSGEEFIGFIVVFSQLLVPVQNIAKNSANLSKAKASQERIEEILNADEKILDPKSPRAIQPLEKSISFTNVSFAYQSELVLKELNFELLKGKTVALVGESGSGKSTIADLLPRFYDVTAGEIAYDGTNINLFSLNDLREQIGIVNQESILFNDTVFNNIAFGMKGVTEEEVIQAAKIANAHEFILGMDEGYHTNIGERGNKLSGGQKQRVSIARAVLKNPPIMILDEATSALDTESEKLVQDALNNLMKNRTSLVIAHRLSTIKNADLILVLRKGEIAERGTHEELFAKKGLYHKLSTMQGL
ncbi:ABC transporter ATP-binding protein [Brumimicrobium oceani]|uniref:Antibiotic ABC transporter ATP-binding protein n=1 Tax=Brumimicrobium oceani TaxID=2100725 RepID=A0A2U2XB00_9FLAO|nr:ABC transporter ATP-binding protein [Brumimicrobium oceani]PWH84881.1 antibiotic ABC transporter ATP-binding protein [Brumimicrobium oceani]